MTFLIGVAIALVIIFGNKIVRSFAGATGVPAKGILLQVSATRSSSFGSGSTRVESRAMRVDVEMAGQPPYEVSGVIQYPASLARDVVPGATVELRVARTNKQNVTIVGPGVAFAAAALNASSSAPAAQLPGQAGPSGQGASS